MYKLHENILQFYKEDPEALNSVQFLTYQLLEDRLEDYNLLQYSKEATEQLDVLWKIGTSYWIFPDSKDIMQIVDGVFLQEKKRRDGFCERS